MVWIGPDLVVRRCFGPLVDFVTVDRPITDSVMALIGCGLRRLSMAPQSVDAVKTMVRSLQTLPLGDYVKGLLTLPDHSVREQLRSFASDHDVAI